jgi:hypothetical protein
MTTMVKIVLLPGVLTWLFQPVVECLLPLLVFLARSKLFVSDVVVVDVRRVLEVKSKVYCLKLFKTLRMRKKWWKCLRIDNACLFNTLVIPIRGWRKWMSVKNYFCGFFVKDLKVIHEDRVVVITPYEISA